MQIMATDDVRLLRPKLRHDTAFLPTAAGAYVHNNDSAFVVKGAQAYRWIAVLAPMLTGQHTVAELCERLPAAHQQTVFQLISALLDRGFAQPVDHTSSLGHLADRDRERFASQINFIEHYA